MKNEKDTKNRGEMSAKNARQKRKCRNKISFNNRNDANHHRNLHIRKYQPRRRVNVYKCTFCKKWHIGHDRKVRV
jgi:hypothetical protein